MTRHLYPLIGLCLLAAACSKPASNEASDAPPAEPASDAGAGAGQGFGSSGPQTLDDMLQRGHERFARLDADQDGKITQAEIDQARSQFQAQRQAQGGAGGPGGGPGGGRGFGGGMRDMMQRLDSNHDGAISQDEMDADTKARFAAMDANHDNQVSPEEMRAFYQSHRTGRQDQGQGGGQAPAPE